MSEKGTVLLERVGFTDYTINFHNPVTGERESYTFPAFVKGSSRKRQVEVSMDCYYYLKDETSCFRNGALKIIEKTERDKELVEEVIQTSPEYLVNSMTGEEIEKLLKSNISAKKLQEKLAEITSNGERQLVVETAKNMKLSNFNKLRAIVDAFYGEDTDVEAIFPAEDSEA